MSTPDKPGRRGLAALESALHTIWYDPNPGLLLRVAGIALRPLSALTGWVAHRRRRQIEHRKTLPHVDTVADRQAFVIVVGNLVAGGAGKTPITIALASHLTQAGYSVGLMCRGGPAGQHMAQLVITDPETGQYDPALGDEAVLLARATGLPVAIGWRRSLALRTLCQLPAPPEVVISDDGLQHVALRRDMELIVVDRRGLGNGRLLPAGPLREPLAAATCADAVILNAGWSAGPPPSPLPQLEPQFSSSLSVRDLIPLSTYWSLNGLLTTDSDAERKNQVAEQAEALRGKKIAAVAAIANPASFFEVLERCELTFDRYLPGDHANLTTEWLNSLDAQAIIITEKDAVKCQPDDAHKIFVLRISAQPETGLITWLTERLNASGKRPNGPPHP